MFARWPSANSLSFALQRQRLDLRGQLVWAFGPANRPCLCLAELGNAGLWPSFCLAGSCSSASQTLIRLFSAKRRAKVPRNHTPCRRDLQDSLTMPLSLRLIGRIRSSSKPFSAGIIGPIPSLTCIFSLDLQDSLASLTHLSKSWLQMQDSLGCWADNPAYSAESSAQILSLSASLNASVAPIACPPPSSHRKLRFLAGDGGWPSFCRAKGPAAWAIRQLSASLEPPHWPPEPFFLIIFLWRTCSERSVGRSLRSLRPLRRFSVATLPQLALVSFVRKLKQVRVYARGRATPPKPLIFHLFAHPTPLEPKFTSNWSDQPLAIPEN